MQKLLECKTTFAAFLAQRTADTECVDNNENKIFIKMSSNNIPRQTFGDHEMSEKCQSKNVLN